MVKRSKNKVEAISAQLFKIHCDCVQFNIMDLSKVTREAEQILASGGSEEDATASIIKMREELRQN